MRMRTRNDRRTCGLVIAVTTGLATLIGCAGAPAIEGEGEAAVKVRASNPLETSVTLQPEAERYCRQFGRIAEPAGSERAEGETWYRYNCLPE